MILDSYAAEQSQYYASGRGLVDDPLGFLNY
jgi:hypothetical protein